MPNAANSLATPVLLPALDPVNARTCDGTQDVVLTIDGIEGLEMVVKAGSMTRADGTVPSAADPAIIALNKVHFDKVPMPMPDGAAPPFAWTLQPAGAIFDPPVQITYPNMSGLPAGSIAYFLSFNHDTNRFEIVATGHVTDDGANILSDPGAGIVKAGWGCNCPPYAAVGDCEGPTPTPTPGSSPTPTPGSSPTPTLGSSPTPTPGSSPTPTPTPTPTPGSSPTPTPGSSPTPTPGASPTPTPGPGGCIFTCASPGLLQGGVVVVNGTADVSDDIVCEGETITFTASGVTHVGGEIKRDCPGTEIVIDPFIGTPIYEWKITSPTLGLIGAGIGDTAIVQNAIADVYICEFTAKVVDVPGAVVNCEPAALPLSVITATAVKVELITPKGDPVAAPITSGDGQNEFSFSDTFPGVLTIDFKAKVVPPSTDLNKVKDLVKFTMENVGKPPAWDAANPNGQASVSGGFLVAQATFTGLPANNIDFGKKKVTIECNGNKKEEVTIEVFFDKSSSNHPGTPATVPNWYYYWAGTAVPGYDLTSGTYSYANGGVDDYAFYNSNPNNPHYTIHGPASAGHEKYNSAGLNVDRKGIDTLAATLVHEKQHLQTDLDWEIGGAWFGKLDTDGDEIPDDLEDTLAGFDKTNKFSFSGFPYGDDEEVWCEMNAFGTTGDSSKDWSNQGKQSKTVF